MLIDLFSKEKSEEFTVHFNPPLNIGPNGKIALINCSLWRSWFNINDSNNLLAVKINNIWKDIKISPGIYSVTDLNDALLTDQVTIEENFNLLKVQIRLQPGVELDLKKSQLHAILGFKPQILTEEVSVGELQPNITNSVDKLQVHCSAVQGSYINNVSSDVLYTFIPEAAPGELINITPSNPIFVDCYPNLNQITMKVTDQSGRLIKLNNEMVTYTLELN